MSHHFIYTRRQMERLTPNWDRLQVRAQHEDELENVFCCASSDMSWQHWMGFSVWMLVSRVAYGMVGVGVRAAAYDRCVCVCMCTLHVIRCTPIRSWVHFSLSVQRVVVNM